MEEIQSGFVRFSHRRCEDCDIREDLHASGAPIPKHRHKVAKCEPCGGKGEIPLGVKDGADPYRMPAKHGREQFYEAKRKLRAHSERHRFRPYTHLFGVCELVMQIPPGGFNHGRTKSEHGSWTPLESEGMDGDILWNPSSKRKSDPLRHGTRYAYQRAGCRCFYCRRWNIMDIRKRRDATPNSGGQITSLRAYVNGTFPAETDGAAAA